MVFPWYSKLVSSFSWRFGSLQVHMALQNRQPAAGDNFDGERRRTRRTQGTQGTQRPWLHISRHCKITCIHMCIMYNICAYVYVCIYMYIYMIMYLCMYMSIYVCPFAYANTCGSWSKFFSAGNDPSSPNMSFGETLSTPCLSQDPCWEIWTVFAIISLYKDL